jgi:hypothetical protein
MKPEMKDFWHGTKQVDYFMGSRGSSEGNGNSYYISIWTKVIQVNDVAHGPLVVV